ncbi:MAG: hypothetical protein J5817_10425 [Treponema sp.]|nr:hypothetical protein [Treponema sp.]
MEKRIKAAILAFLFATGSSAVSAEVAFNAGTLSTDQDQPQIQRLSSSSDTSGDILSELFSLLWLVNNLTVSFDAYPYANGRYLTFEGFSLYGSDKENSAMQDWRFEIESNAFVFPKKVWGVESRLEGILWKFIGPVFENTIYYPIGDWEDNNDFEEHPSALPPPEVAMDIFDPDRKYAGNVRLGGQLSLWYANPLSLSVFLQWSKWYGAIDCSGTELGLIAKSYPADPILVEWRGSIQMLKDKYHIDSIYESHLEIGAMVAPRIEVYGAWKYTHNPLLNVKGHGAAAGAKIHW